MSNKTNWQINSWRDLPILQQPKYPDQNELKIVEEQLKTFPPLVAIDEIEQLNKQLEAVCHRQAFLLQGGDCAESFGEFSHDNLKSFFRTIMQMTIALMHGIKKPVVKIGRIAGQYAKPRSQDFEDINGIMLPSYRGDIINKIDDNLLARTPDPKLLIESYFYSASSLNYLRSLALGGYGNLSKINKWNEEFIHNISSDKSIENVVDEINDMLDFIKSCGLDTKSIPQLTTASFFTSHEALLLNYEEAFTKFSTEHQKYYDLSAHFLWIGDRTRNPNHAHIEFMRGISNPIAFKVGPSISKEDLIALIKILNPDNIAGRLTLITRMGADKVSTLLKPLIAEVQKHKLNVIWTCDPMHGNTIKSTNGYKTRKFDDVLKEILEFFKLHKELDSYAGGVHFEMTGQDVTECLGGNQNISELNLKDRYHTHCDPRLNSSQSIELAFAIAEEFKKINK